MTLAKDCACVTHDGPCFLHMARLDRERNRKLWASAGRTYDVVLAEHVLEAEARRLAELTTALRRAGFAEGETLPDEVREVVRFLPEPASAEAAA